MCAPRTCLPKKKSDPSNLKKSARATRSLCALRAHVCPPIINRCPLLAPPLFQSWCRHCSKFTLISLFSKIHSLKSEHIHSFLFREYMRASLENFCIFTFKTAISFNILLVLQKLCRYKWHICRLIHVPTDFQTTDKTPKKHYWGGGGIAPPPPSLRLATLVVMGGGYRLPG